MSEKNEKSVEHVRDQDESYSGLPVYEEVVHSSAASQSRSTTVLMTEEPYHDDVLKPRSSAQSYGSHSVGPSRGTASPGSTSLFASWGSKSTASQSLQRLYRDIIAQPSPATASILATICETCQKGNIQLSSVTSMIDGHRPIFWTIVNEKKMPGTVDVLLSQSHKLTQLSPEEVREGQIACLVHESLEIYRQLQRKLQALNIQTSQNSEDTIEIVRTEAPVLGFIANITLKDYVARYRVKGDLSVSFPARHREWCLHIGSSRLPDRYLRDSHSRTRSAKTAELILEHGDPLPCTARIRLRHPTCASESEWLNLGTLQAVTEAMRHVQARRTEFMAFAGPASLTKNQDWQALEFGETEFLDANGDVSIQLQVVAQEERSAGGDCSIQ